MKRISPSCKISYATGALLLALGSLVISPDASAQLYRWTDDTGRVIVSDTPPPAGKAQKIGKAPAVDDRAKNKAEEKKASSSLDPEVEMRVREGEKKEKGADEKRKRAIAEYCEASKDRLAQLQSGDRIQVRDKSGEKSFMTDQQRAEEINKTKSGMQEQKCP